MITSCYSGEASIVYECSSRVFGLAVLVYRRLRGTVADYLASELLPASSAHDSGDHRRSPSASFYRAFDHTQPQQLLALVQDTHRLLVVSSPLLPRASVWNNVPEFVGSAPSSPNVFFSRD